MSKLRLVIMLLGLGSFYWGAPLGIGWILGWIFITLLRIYRIPLLDKIIGDFSNFSSLKYSLYLLGVFLWIAIPLGLSIIFPDQISFYTIFAAYLLDRFISYATQFKG